MDWSLETWQSLVRATALVAGALVVEHYAVILIGRLLNKRSGATERADGWGPPARFNYAVGLVTDAGGLLLWAGLLGVAMTPLVAAVLLVAMGAAGGPDFIIHLLEERRARELQAERERAEAEARAAEARETAGELEELRHLAARYPRLAQELARWRLAGNRRHFTNAANMLEGIGGNVAEMRLTLDAVRAQADHLERMLAALVDVDGGGAAGQPAAWPPGQGWRAGVGDLEI